MQHSTCLIAGRKGQLMEVEQVGLFKYCIAGREFNLAVHPEPELRSNPEARRLVVSLYETGCKLATLRTPVGDAIAEASSLRLLVRDSIQSLSDEIGSDRLAQLLDNSLSDHQPLNG